MDAENKYGAKAVQEYLLPILKAVDQLCRKNEIEYSLMGGGLLGSIRHKGFVPWDDDIDIIFDRENYERFLEIADTQLPTDYTIIGSIWVKRITRKDNPRLEQEEGCIDLFVFDQIPKNMLIEKIKNFSLMLLQGMLKVQLNYNRFPLSLKILIFTTHILGKFFSKKRKLKMYDSVSQWGNKGDSEYVNNYITYFKMISSVKYEKRYLGEYIDADFENLKVRIFKHYDYFLRVQFGDYMTLPPEEKRKPTHILVS